MWLSIFWVSTFVEWMLYVDSVFVNFKINNLNMNQRCKMHLNLT